MPKGNRGGKQRTKGLKLNLQLFAKKRTGIHLPPKEYGKVIHEIDTLYYDYYKDKEVFVHYSGDKNNSYKYRVKNYNYNQYQILSKRRVK